MNEIILDRQFDNIVIIKINRPEVMNALDKKIISELNEVIDIANNDNNVKVIIITGAGEKSFCAGGDIRYVHSINPIEAEEYATYAHNLLNKIENLEKPVIAAINGFALGGGCQLALACDIRIASSNAKIGQTEVKIGITPGWGGTQRLTRLIGMAKAKELIYTGKIITAFEAKDIGLINKIIELTDNEMQVFYNSIQEKMTNTVPPIESEENPKYKQNQLDENKKRQLNQILNRKLIEESISLANEIIKNSHNSIKISKMLINKGMDAPIDTGLRLEIYGMALSFDHTDRQKMMRAYINKKENKKKDN